MSSFKTIVTAGALTLLLTAPLEASDALHEAFAGCAGRMSAEMEHAWLVGNDADSIEAARLTFLSLLDATLSEGQERAALARRIDSKLAHASLLTIGTFSQTPQQAEQARLRARWHITHCQDMLLDS